MALLLELLGGYAGLVFTIIKLQFLFYALIHMCVIQFLQDSDF